MFLICLVEYTYTYNLLLINLKFLLPIFKIGNFFFKKKQLINLVPLVNFVLVGKK